MLHCCSFHRNVDPQPDDIIAIPVVVVAGGGILLPEAGRPPQLRCRKLRGAEGLQLEYTQ